MNKEQLYQIENLKKKLRTIDFGDTVICITRRRNVHPKLSSITNFMYLCSIEKVGGSSYNSRYYRAKVLLTEKVYKRKSYTVFAINVLEKV